MKIIVDTNNAFSAILNSTRKIGKILINSKDHFQFYSCDFLKIELLNHRAKLLKLTKLTPIELDELEAIVTQKITFINEALIPKQHLLLAAELLKNIDMSDIPFVALTKHLKGKLWTGDKELIKGLTKKGFRDFITTTELSDLMNKLEK